VAEAPRTLARRLHSISGIVPVGVFLVVHLATNSAAWGGADGYNAMARRLQGLPGLAAIEILLVAVPLFFHAIYGLFLIADPPAEPARRATPAALRVAQRVTGVVLFAFVLFHLWTARLVQIRDHESLDLFRLMQSALASPWIRAVYAAGILAATFHLSAGVWTFSEGWGLASTRRARRAVAAAAAALFLALSATGLASLAAFRL
jgi:succinate dehydrogenase / fumarate reductase cytochrome b subunit